MACRKQIGVEELPEDVICVIINPTIWLIEELYTLITRLFMLGFYSAVDFVAVVDFFIKQGKHLGGGSSSGNDRHAEKLCPQKAVEADWLSYAFK